MEAIEQAVEFVRLPASFVIHQEHQFIFKAARAVYMIGMIYDICDVGISKDVVEPRYISSIHTKILIFEKAFSLRV